MLCDTMRFWTVRYRSCSVNLLHSLVLYSISDVRVVLKVSKCVSFVRLRCDVCHSWRSLSADELLSFLEESQFTVQNSHFAINILLLFTDHKSRFTCCSLTFSDCRFFWQVPWLVLLSVVIFVFIPRSNPCVCAGSNSWLTVRHCC